MTNGIGRKALLAACLALAGCLCPVAGASAQVPLIQVNEAAWDVDNALNRSEVGAYLTLWSAGLAPGGNAGPAHNYTFTNPLPSVFDIVCGRELVLFRTLYSHRLDEGPFASPFYGIWNLLNDDATVRKQFVAYFIEHRLATPLDGDQQVLAKHLAAIQDAWYVGDKYDIFGDVTVAEQELISTSLKEKMVLVIPPAPPPAPRPPDPTPEALKCFEFWLRQSIISSTIMDCLTRSGTTWPLNIPGADPKVPDFDCDDYTYIEMAWLRKLLKQRFPDAEYQIYGYSRKCPGQAESGHAVLIVRHGDYIWIVDPQTNQVVGPFKKPISDAEIKRQIRKLMKDWYPNICDTPSDENLWPSKPGDHPHDDRKKENPPWQEDWLLPVDHPRKGDPQKDMWERFKRKLAECCAQSPPPTPPAGCDPLFDHTEVRPDPCKPENYLWPRL